MDLNLRCRRLYLVRLPKLLAVPAWPPAGCQRAAGGSSKPIWDRRYLNLSGPAMITIGGDNNGEIAFGALQAGLDLSYSPSIVHFTWGGCDEMDEVTSPRSVR